jgi:alpha-methylacyl-CoA racemase
MTTTPGPPLAGVTVLDLASVGPAARCTRILADYGAIVVKIGPPPQKRGVQIEPPFFTYAAGRGTKRVRIDLRAPEGTRAFLRLAAKADVLIESFRPGVAARLGIGYDEVRAVNPRLVYCSTSGYGQAGPYAGWAGHDLNYLALGGYLGMSGRRADGRPALPGATVADAAAGGMHAAIAILAALVRRQATGNGAYLDVAVADGVLALTALHVERYLATGEEPQPGSDILSGRYACYDVYAARDGKWLAVAAIEPAFWANLCRALGLERWVPHQLDDDRQEEMRADLVRVFGERDRDDWVARLAPNDTCVAPVYSIAELTRDPQLASRGVFVEAVHQEHGTFRQVGPVLAGAERPATPCALPPPNVTETDGVLRGAGLADHEIAALRDAGVVA